MNDEEYHKFLIDQKYIDVSTTNSHKHKTKTLECPICYCDDELYVANPCGHMYCKSCTKKITKCGICRSEINNYIQIRFPWKIDKDYSVFEKSVCLRGVGKLHTNIHFISLCVQNIVYIYVYNIVFTLTDKMNINTINSI